MPKIGNPKILNLAEGAGKSEGAIKKAKPGYE